MTDSAATPASASPQSAVASQTGATAVAEPGRSKRRLWESWSRWIFAIGEDRMFLLLSVVIGVFSGLAVVCFRIAIEFTKLLLLGSPHAGGRARAVGAHPGRPWHRPSGSACIPQVARWRRQPDQAGRVRLNGYIPFGTVIGKFIVCSLAIGSGRSLGPEDPALQMGAGIASEIGRELRLSQRKVRMIAPVGAAAGLAAAFNAPISAVLFVIEEVIGAWSAGILGAIVLSAVSSVVTMRWFLGRSLFRVPFRAHSSVELFAYVALGIVGGTHVACFHKVDRLQPPEHSSPSRLDAHLQPAIAVPSRRHRNQVPTGARRGLRDHRPGAAPAVYVETPVGSWRDEDVAAGISFLSGKPGGMFAPSLLIGAMLGGGIGAIEQRLLPHLTGTVGIFALVGMGTVFGRVSCASLLLPSSWSLSFPAAIRRLCRSWSPGLIAYLISRHYQEVSPCLTCSRGKKA